MANAAARQQPVGQREAHHPSARIFHYRVVAAWLFWLVKGKKITHVTIVTNPENSRSQFIDEQSVPLLVQETLKAQSYNIDEVSGATMTSDAYMQSL